MCVHFSWLQNIWPRCNCAARRNSASTATPEGGWDRLQPYPVVTGRSLPRLFLEMSTEGSSACLKNCIPMLHCSFCCPFCLCVFYWSSLTTSYCISWVDLILFSCTWGINCFFPVWNVLYPFSGISSSASNKQNPFCLFYLITFFTLVFDIVTQWALLWIPVCLLVSEANGDSTVGWESGTIIGRSLQAWLCTFLYYECLFLGSVMMLIHLQLINNFSLSFLT